MLIERYTEQFGPEEEDEEEEEEEDEPDDDGSQSGMSASHCLRIAKCVLNISPFAGDDSSFSRKMQRAMLSALGKAPKEFVHVDMQQKMIEKGLLNLIPAEAWPPTNAVGHCTLCSFVVLCQWVFCRSR